MTTATPTSLRDYIPIICVLMGTVLGWLLAVVTRYFDETWFGAKLKIECQRARGVEEENKKPHRGLHKISCGEQH